MTTSWTPLRTPLQKQVDTERAPFVKRAFKLYATGSYSLKKISDLLFQEGFRSRSGYKYRKGRIQKILKDPFYHGVMYVHGIYYAGNHDTLISKERCWKRYF